ncbi:AGAP001271-PA-like protein [Anopheles sinensis]|uniref:Pre-mRNA cleavage complex 2 protein Pcf11 n=1 Tax=Anopheles sinensis TaxID=74873 RepID=A0A084W0L6_ANOSI|nr:AGAP001271-PA-like protein [Anopheles sinensis]
MDETSLLDKRAKEIEQEYLSSLADLNVNSKPLINMLTILAEENLEYAQIIVSAVEKHLAKVVPDVKLPILYLVDSIVKNVGKQYQSLFSQVIVNMFCGVFETVNEKIREKMYSLRQTWNEVFPQSKLFALDIKVHSMDPGWPITAQLKPKIHVNPMFLKATVRVPESSMHQQLQDKHRELLELQARKLELELFATKKRIEEQEKQLSLQTASVAKEPPPEVRRALDPSAGPPSMVSAAGGGLISTAIPPPGVLAKSRIAPVPQGMISMVKTRDPRLAKQQAAAQLVAHTAAGTRMMMGAGAHAPSLGPMTVPPPVLTPALTMDTTNHAPSKSSSSPSVRDRLGSKVRRVEPVGGSSSSVRSETSSTEDNGRINKKQSSSSSVNASSHKSRHDHDHKSRKERKEHSSSSTSTSSGGSNKLSTRNDRGSSGKTSSSSVSRAGGSTSGGPEKRKQRTHSNSDGSPQGRKSPHTTSPGKKKTSSSSEKSNHSSDGSTKGSEKSSRSESKGSPPSSKVSRHARSNSTDGRKQEHSTGGGDHHQQASNSHDAQDIDLRFSIPEKRIKIDESISEGRRLMGEMHEEGTTDAQKTSDVKNISPTDEEEAVSAMIAKDIDIRSLPLHLLPNKRNTKELDGEIAVAPFRSREPPVAIRLDDDDEDSDETAGGKKRSTTGKSDEPTAKKSKAEMIDALFGNEDVDLRQLPIGGTMLEAPPSMISADNQEVSFVKLDGPRSPLLEKNGANRSDAVRAKLAEVVKNQEKDKLGRPLLYNKLPDDPIERRRSISSLAKPGDIDLRSLPPPVNVLDDDDNSMDSMNSNIKTIIAQAQEQMEKGEITPEQYSILMKQVIQLNETQKIRQAQRIEHGTKQSEPVVIRIDDNGSLSGEDDVIVTSVTPASSSSTSTNDFRGKIHPIDGKPPFEVPFGKHDLYVFVCFVDPRRQRESKWNRVEPSPVAWPNRGAPGAPPPGVVGPPIAGGIRSGTGTAVPSPWETAPFPVNPPPTRHPVPSILPPLGMVPHVGASLQPNNGGQPSVLLSANAKMNDSVQTINIDGIQREIRFYEDTAVIFMNWDEPKEIGFQKGSRMVVVDGRETFELGFNEPYKSVSIDNKVYQMRLGAPTRELYIDDRWYECYFGDTLNTIRLGDSQRIFKIAGPAPQVKIGELRNDLVAGKINMIVDAKYIIPVFLDCKVQTFELNGQAHTLQFADFLLTVVLDEHPYPVDFGSLPKVYRLRGREYYIRFTSLPNNVQPGNVYIRDMIRTPLFRDLRTPPKDPAALVQAPPVANVNSLPFGPTGGPVLGIPPPSLGAPPFGGIPLLANINVEELYKKIVAAGIITKLGGGGSNSTAPGAAANDGGKDAKDEVKPKDKETKPPVPAIEPVLLDKPETLKKRQSAIVHQLYSGMQCSSCGVRFPPEQTMKYSQHLDWHFRQNRRDRDSARKAHSRKWYYDVSDWIQYEEIEDLEEREKNWFETQQTGDGQGDSVKKGHGGGSGGGGGGGVGGGSGPGGCDGDDSSPNGEWGSPQPSCPAGSDEDDRQCHMCHEVFEQFYNEETEEWHLKCAIRVDGSTYHPLCYEDYKASLTMSETTLGDNTTVGAGSLDGDDESRKTDTTMETGEAGGDGDGEEGTPDGTGTSAEGAAAAAAKATSKKKTKNGKGADNEDEDEDDDVIVLPTVEPVVEEILDDDAEEPSGDGAADPNGDEPVAKSPMARQPEFQERQIDEDLFIQEPNIEVTDLDDIEDKPASSGTGSGQPADGAGGAGGDENSLSSLLRVKIKEEPKEDDEVDEEDALFEEVGTIESSLLDVNEHSSPMETNVEEDLYEDVIVESVPSPAEGTSNQQMAVQSSKPSLDGNVELQDPPQAAVLVPNRIKINITKSKALQNNGGQGANEGETGDGSNVNSNFNENSQSGGAEATDEGSGGGAGGPSAMFDELSNDAVSGWGDEVEENRINSTSTAAALVPAEVAFEETTNVAYERKPTLAGIEFSRCPRVTSGSEASGLCSIM